MLVVQEIVARRKVELTYADYEQAWVRFKNGKAQPTAVSAASLRCLNADRSVFLGDVPQAIRSHLVRLRDLEAGTRMLVDFDQEGDQFTGTQLELAEVVSAREQAETWLEESSRGQ